MTKEMDRVEFTKEMRKTHTLLFPDMCPIHFTILQNVLRSYGYKIERLTNNDQTVIDEGLKYVHNDICYPCLLTTGQMIAALKSGKYDLDHVALMMAQTGGGCRASNYIFLIRKALKKAGMGHIPVVSVNLSGLEKNSGFKIGLPILRRALAALVYGDMLMLLSNQTRPYEKNKGETDDLIAAWIDKVCAQFEQSRGFQLRDIAVNLKEIIRDFEKIDRNHEEKVKVGIVGEIYAKYSPLANNNLELFLRSQDCEINVPGIMGFMLFKVDNRIEDIKLYGGKILKRIVVEALMWYLKQYEKCSLRALEITQAFHKPASYAEIKKMVEPFVGYGCRMGEGWFLTGEMIELIQSGYGNIVCCQPFGCLPNHVVGKGKIRQITEVYPEANIVPIDYDPGATKVNQENRIKLMLSVAREKLQKS